jgi:phage FluMu protein Com
LNGEERTSPTVLDDAMPITFSCPCGKILRVADEHAGKRVKCPACNTISSVPAPEPEPVFEIVEPAPKPVTPARPVARPVAEEDEETGGTYGLARPGGGRVPVRRDDDENEGESGPGTYGLAKGGRGGTDDDGPRDKPLPDFRLGSGQRRKKRKNK